MAKKRVAASAASAVEVIDLGDLTPDPENAREHTPRNIGMIGDSLQETGAWRSIGVDEDNVVYMGNGVVEAAAERGFRKVMVVDADGETIVAVRRRGLTPEQKKRAALYDNRAGELAEWNLDAIAALNPAERANLWTDDEISAIVERAEAAREEHEEPEAPEGFRTVDENIETEFACPKCGYEWSGKG